MIAYITGSSKGIGKALALKLLNDGHKVVGLSRSCTIVHPNYKHETLDLSDLKLVSDFHFDINTTDNIILINNAGSIGPIKPIGHQTNNDIINLNNLNVITPELLCNKFIHQFSLQENQYQIVNVSSGAGKRPIDAWATYCASKSAIDLFSETILEELKERNFMNWDVFSIAPGVVDTDMQNQIRASKPHEFLSHQKFLDLKSNNELLTPAVVADLICNVIYSPNDFKSVIISVRDLI